MIKFDKLDQFKKQREANSAKQDELYTKQAQATEAVVEAKRKYTELVERSIRDGVDLDAEIDKADVNVSDAQRVARRIEAQIQATSVSKGLKVTPEDVAGAWNTDVAPVYFESVLNPAIDELAQAAEAYRQAYEKATAAAKKIEDERWEMIRTIDPAGFSAKIGRGRFMYNTKSPDLSNPGSPFNQATLTSRDLQQLDNQRRAAILI
ncbi:hypothetical protein [Paenibacillus amylolyticus]|uniref:Uncharacterized protein n=1 Tax=Paenibacillus amylolyticus TaxID=1451 RepID=A0A117I3P3_PAEAM|nr:hypothetical protein [Paenibacillus amylolyticus]GAS85654.1 unknown protein [Paenibacillus amylolyticus]